MNSLDKLIAHVKALPEYSDAELEANTAARKQAAVKVGLRASTAVIRRYTRSPKAVPDMDAVQEAIVAALEAETTFKAGKGASLRTWMFRRAYGAAIDYYKREQAQGMGGKDYAADTADIDALLSAESTELYDEDYNSTEFGEHALGVYPSEEERALALDINRFDLEAAVSSLPNDLRHILVSYYGYKTKPMTLQAIADREDVSIGTVRNRLKEAIALLAAFRDI